MRFANGKALVAIGLYQYRETSIANYNEVGTALVVVPKGLKPSKAALLSLYGNPDKSDMGFFVIDLPVTTADACASGREAWATQVHYPN